MFSLMQKCFFISVFFKIRNIRVRNEMTLFNFSGNISHKNNSDPMSTGHFRSLQTYLKNNTKSYPK